jgi:hypothetical protein
VKVVQRIPVRIDFTNLSQEDKDLVLRPGLSVTPDVEVKSSDVPSSCPPPNPVQVQQIQPASGGQQGQSTPEGQSGQPGQPSQPQGQAAPQR